MQKLIEVKAVLEARLLRLLDKKRHGYLIESDRYSRANELEMAINLIEDKLSGLC